MRYFISVFALLISTTIFAQTKVFTQDIVNFYTAFDNVCKQTNKTEQLNSVQVMYVDKASNGLKDFIALGGGNTQKWLNYMSYNKAYLQEMRPYLESVLEQNQTIQNKLAQIKQIYPSFKDGNIYFIIGCGIVGGSPNKQSNSLIIGAEVLVKKNAEWAVPTAIHEFIHLQQKEGNRQLLTQIIDEGVAEFLSEVFFEKNLANNGYAPHIAFGNKNKNKVWHRFKSDMFLLNRGYLGWLYSSKNFDGVEVQDVGYYVGYKICKSYYDKAENKNLAIKTLLELDLSSDESIRTFVLESGYLTDKDKEFVKNAKFTDKQSEQLIKKVRYGYKIEGDNIIFEYHVPALFLNKYKGNIDFVSIAGSFNNWNPNNEEFKMIKQSDNSFVLTIPKSKIDLKTVPQFKFVLNEDIWMQVPDIASNVDEKSQNLMLINY